MKNENVGDKNEKNETQALIGEAPKEKNSPLKIAAFVVGMLLFGAICFYAGLSAGFMRAKYTLDWGENFERNFGGPRHGFQKMPPPFFGDELRNGFGVNWNGTASDGEKLVVTDRDGKENTVVVGENTQVHYPKKDDSKNSIQIGDRVVVVGRPGAEGVINADFIRVFPPKRTNGN